MPRFSATLRRLVADTHKSMWTTSAFTAASWLLLGDPFGAIVVLFATWGLTQIVRHENSWLRLLHWPWVGFCVLVLSTTALFFWESAGLAGALATVLTGAWIFSLIRFKRNPYPFIATNSLSPIAPHSLKRDQTNGPLAARLAHRFTSRER